MRRPSPDLSYKKRTGKIVSETFRPWQLISKDEREGIHRFINTSVSITEDILAEGKYIEDMFFPDTMDVNHAHVLFVIPGKSASATLRINGTLLADITETTVPKKTSLYDDMILGMPDRLVLNKSISHTYSGVKSIGCVMNNTITVLSGNAIIEIDRTTGLKKSEAVCDNIVTESTETIFDSIHRTHVIRDIDGVRDLSVKVYSEANEIPRAKVLYRKDFGDVWNSALDFDGNGLVWLDEENVISRAAYTDSSQYTPEEWDNVKWIDINNNNIIDETDIKSVRMMIPSAAPDVSAAVTVPDSYIGTFTITYEKDLPRTVALVNTDRNNVTKIKEDNPITGIGSKITYDFDKSIYYLIESNDLVAVRMNDSGDNIIASDRIDIFFDGTGYNLIDVSFSCGFVFVLCHNPSSGKYRVYYGDGWSEYLDRIESYAELPAGLTGITSFAINSDFEFVFASPTHIYVLEPERDKVYINGSDVILTKRHTVTEGAAQVNTIPEYVFNPFDSFAYSLGISRSWGLDNKKLRDIIYDFYRYEQSNSSIGMNYGIMREFGYTNEKIITSGKLYTVPAELVLSGNIEINDVSYPVTEATTSVITPSGEILINPEPGVTYLIPSDEYCLNKESILLDGIFKDRFGNTQNLAYNILIDSGNTSPTIKVNSYADIPFLESNGYVLSGAPTQKFIDLISKYEDLDESRYKRAKVDVNSFSSARMSTVPITDTIYSPSVTIDTLSDIEVSV